MLNATHTHEGKISRKTRSFTWKIRMFSTEYQQGPAVVCVSGSERLSFSRVFPFNVYIPEHSDNNNTHSRLKIAGEKENTNLFSDAKKGKEENISTV